MAQKKPSEQIKAIQGKLQKQVYKATDEVVAEMDRQFTAAISADDWEWPREPSPRDIVDTGALRASQRYTKLQDGTYQFTWGVPYAASVHEGGTFYDGSEMPGRPWTRRAIAKMQQNKTVPKILGENVNGKR